MADAAGSSVRSRKADHDGSAILDALDGVLALACQVCWAVDIAGATSALLPAPLAARGQDLNLRPLDPQSAVGYLRHDSPESGSA